MDEQPRLYRSPNGIVLGICQGVADRYVLPVFWVRTAVILLALLTAVIPAFLIYLLLGFVLKPEPHIPFQTEEVLHKEEQKTSGMAERIDILQQRTQELENELDRLRKKVNTHTME